MSKYTLYQYPRKYTWYQFGLKSVTFVTLASIHCMSFGYRVSLLWPMAPRYLRCFSYLAVEAPRPHHQHPGRSFPQRAGPPAAARGTSKPSSWSTHSSYSNWNTQREAHGLLLGRPMTAQLCTVGRQRGGALTHTVHSHNKTDSPTLHRQLRDDGGNTLKHLPSDTVQFNTFGPKVLLEKVGHASVEILTYKSNLVHLCLKSFSRKNLHLSYF